MSRSGGLSNELNNIIARNTDGVCEGVAIGGDRLVAKCFAVLSTILAIHYSINFCRN